jgi:hypothetical protein
VFNNVFEPGAYISAAGAEGTVILQSFLEPHFFRLVDTRGFFEFGLGEFKEWLNVLQVRHK